MSTTPLRTHPHCVKITPAPLGFLVSVENMNQWARGGMKIALPYQNENRVTSRFNLQSIAEEYKGVLHTFTYESSILPLVTSEESGKPLV